MANSLMEFALLCLTSLFTMINPVSITPVFSSITADLPVQQARHVALKATMTAFAILVTFALTGSIIFKVFAISVNSLKIVGGVLFFLMGYEMVQARMGRTRIDKQEEMEDLEEYTNNVAITPLAIPLICGPGAIATVIILMEQHKDILFRSVLFLSILTVIGVTYLFLLFAKPIMDRLGESGNKVLMRIMGLIVMVIAVEYFFGGLKPMLRDIFEIVPLANP
ncbi:MarC family protein [Kistimonas asteriae]|uniref:MarC family protein n=1 Tax=Kistimonas asteriae TaxID=517724 RepID=UPI001BAAB9BE|nr:MarC family protein [Kistimonas asteriae]